MEKLGFITKHELYSRAAQKPQPTFSTPEHMLFDHEFTKLVKELEGQCPCCITAQPSLTLHWESATIIFIYQKVSYRSVTDREGERSFRLALMYKPELFSLNCILALIMYQ